MFTFIARLLGSGFDLGARDIMASEIAYAILARWDRDYDHHARDTPQPLLLSGRWHHGGRFVSIKGCQTIGKALVEFTFPEIEITRRQLGVEGMIALSPGETMVVPNVQIQMTEDGLTKTWEYSYVELEWDFVHWRILRTVLRAGPPKQVLGPAANAA